MAAANRESCISLILQLEGGNTVTNDPNDPGGLTKYGISRRSYPNENIQALSEDRARQIYQRDYWDAVKGDNLRSGVDILVFDSAVNQGVAAAVRMLQVAARTMPDGVIGSDTLAAAAQDGVFIRFAAQRALRYCTTPNFQKYGLGWMTRLFTVFKRAVELNS